MTGTTMRTALLSLVLIGFAGAAAGHGLMEDPPSRNWFCGAITKPDEVLYGVPEFPECGGAFADNFEGGYQFMSVLTHDRGRTAVSPLPQNVCGFDSETFNGGATPWDAAIDWPTTPMSPGRQEFKWNIQWGPHFDDTEEFRYWITKPDFQYEVGKPLSWDDFESAEFCTLTYSDADPGANPDVIPLKESSQFRTFCEVPERSGRHVIYGEWGRNFFTFERFHGCVDVVFNGTAPPPVDPVTAEIGLDPDVDTVVGETSINLDGSASLGAGLAYTWSVNAPDSSLYSIDDPSQAVTTLRLAAPAASQSVTISLLVSNADGSASASRTVLHESEVASSWRDLGPLTAAPQTLNQGDQVSVRTVLGDGQDIYYPATPLLIGAGNAAAEAWPLALAQAIGAIADADIAIGVLGGNDQVTAIADATANRIYAVAGSAVVSAFLDIESLPDPGPSPDCIVSVRDGANPWWAGLDVGADSETFTLDFAGTGLVLGDNLTLDAGVFSASISGQLLTLTKPPWVNAGNPGYMGFNASNNPALATFSPPRCQ